MASLVLCRVWRLSVLKFPGYCTAYVDNTGEWRKLVGPFFWRVAP